jgi:biopolymer transport protein ExbD
MAMTSGDSGDDGFSDINITPFVDIVLVLLVIFMVTAKYIASQSIPVDLPKAASGASGIQTMIACSIDAKQQMYEKEENVRVIISADRVVPHGRVVELIDLVRGAGIDKFAIQTEQPPNPPT